MARSSSLRLAALIIANVLIPLAVVIFASGFFPYKPFLPGLATSQDEQEGIQLASEAVFDRVVFMVVDALRSDFVYGYNSGFEFTQSLIRSGAAVPFTAHATPPTVTMPRVKALTTGSVPSFLDLILNFAESDTTSSLAAQDTWLAQIKAKGGKLVFYGDDTWLKLFPGNFFARSDGTSSFFVSDFTEVDTNVTRHVPGELARDDWDAMIMHYLGLDHIGHKTGPQGPNMLPKQREMDGMVQQIYEAMEEHPHHAKTLLVLAGDHGMNAGGNHGGSGPGETEPALLFASPRFKDMGSRESYDCPTSPKAGTEFHYYHKIEQSDVVPMLASFFGMPIPLNSLGVLIPQLSGVWSEKQHLSNLRRNAEQILGIIRAKYGSEHFESFLETYDLATGSAINEDLVNSDDERRLASLYAPVLHTLEKSDHALQDDILIEQLYSFLQHAQRAMSDTASLYDVPKMIGGIALAIFALLLALASLPSIWGLGHSGLFFTTICGLYAVMMFASSYVEEEQHFWYWLTPVWIVLLTAESLSNSKRPQIRVRIAIAGALLLFTHRAAVRWNQTGQKHAGEPDIAHTIFPQQHIVMWVLILIAYSVNGFLLHLRTFADILMTELAVFLEVSLTFLATVFKLNFTQADAPELVQGLAARIREYSEPFSLVEQARVVFGLLAVAAVIVIVLSIDQHRAQSRRAPVGNEETNGVSLAERLHHLLTLFLMTQTRAANIPIFAILELQRLCLSWLLSSDDQTSKPSYKLATKVATSTLLLSNVFYFSLGGSNSISSIDLSNAYNGVADYNISAVALLLFASNWTGAIWWCSAAVLLMHASRRQPPQPPIRQSEDGKAWVNYERAKLHEAAVASLRPAIQDFSADNASIWQSWSVYVACMTCFVSSSLLAVMASCTILRTHLFIWTVFSPKYLYAMAWAVGWHLVVNIGLGSLLYRFAQIV